MSNSMMHGQPYLKYSWERQGRPAPKRLQTTLVLSLQTTSRLQERMMVPGVIFMRPCASDSAAPAHQRTNTITQITTEGSRVYPFTCMLLSDIHHCTIICRLHFSSHLYICAAILLHDVKPPPPVVGSWLDPKNIRFSPHLDPRLSQFFA